tara:strand:+ start:1343 stop:1789 length:447 start_codon:yes stop_codon:yes gene_type:complete
MHLTTKGKYAITALLDLSLNQTSGYTSIQEIALRQDISMTYLEQLFRNLRKAGIVESLRGPKGGYRLTRLSSEINVSEVVSAVENKMDATQCGGTADCDSGKKCLTHDLWSELNDQVESFLLSKSLEDVIGKKRKDFKDLREGLIAVG